MAGQLCEIISRQKEIEVEQGKLAHFELSAGTAVDSETVANDRNWTIYCLDPETRQALFLELPEGTDLSLSPFSYMTQFDLAKRAMLVPFEELSRAAGLAPFPPNLVMVFSIGRCGSTLVSKIFAEVPNVWSISEPDPITNLAVHRDRFDPGEFNELIAASIRLSYCPLPGQDVDTFVVKHRSQASFILESMLAALPASKNVYLYRDADSWAQSINHFAQRLGVDVGGAGREQLQFMWNILSCNSPESELKRILGTSEFPTEPADLMAACWLVNMERIFSATDGNADTAFSYNQLNNERTATVERLLDGCGLDGRYLSSALAAYSEHSQKGTSATRDVSIVPLSDAQRARIAELTARHPESSFGTG